MRNCGEHDDNIGIGRNDRGVGQADEDVPLDATAPSEAFREAMWQLGELKDYAAQFVAAKAGSIKAGIRNGVAWTVLGILALIAGTAIIVTAAALLVIGLAQAVAALLGGYAWAGNLIVGFVVLGAILLTGWLAVRHFFNASRSKTLASYERRLQQQRAHHGHDARQRSTEQRREQRHESQRPV